MRSLRQVVTWTAAGVILLVACSPAGASGQLQLIQLLSPRLAKQFLQTVEWQRYEATQINIAEEEAWEDPAIFLDLKGDPWKVEFPNDTFISLDRFFFGDIARPRPVEGNVRQAALALLERDLVHVYRIRLGGEVEGPDRAIILTPYTIRAFTLGSTIRIKLDENGLFMREGELLDGGDDDNVSSAN